MSESDGQSSNGGARQRQKVSAFDVRTIIAILIGAYGIILVLLGIFHATEEELERANGFNINLWAGIGMLIFAGVFALWTKLRPIVIETDGEEGPKRVD